MTDDNPLAEYQTTEERTNSHEPSVDEILRAQSARRETAADMQRKSEPVQEERAQGLRQEEMKPSVDEILAEQAKKIQPDLNRPFIEKEPER